MYDPELLIQTPHVALSQNHPIKQVSVSRSMVEQTVDPDTGDTIERLIAGRPYEEREVVGIFGGQVVMPEDTSTVYRRKTEFLNYKPGQFSSLLFEEPEQRIVMVQDGDWRRGGTSLEKFLERGHAASIARRAETGHNAYLASFTCRFAPEEGKPMDDTNLGTRRGVTLLIASRTIQHGEEILVPGKK